MATPGSSVTSGSLLTPGGDRGPSGPSGAPGATGTNAATPTIADFTVPAYGSTVQVSLTDASWVVVGERVYVATAGGGTTPGTLLVQAKSGNLLTLLNPAPATPGDMFKSVYDTDNDGAVDTTESVFWTDITGKPSAFPNVAHAPTHESGGTDVIKLDEFAAPTDTTALNVSASAHGLAPKAPNDITQILRGDGVWAPPVARNFARYTRQRYCDSPLGGSDVSATSGTGAAIATAVAAQQTAGHYGVWSLTSGTTANSYASLLSSTTSPEFNLNVVNKLAFRCVFKTGATLPSGGGSATTFAEYLLGFRTPINTTGVSVGTGIVWRFLPVISNWVLQLENGTNGQSYNTTPTVTVAASTWYDARIYWDANGVVGKIGVYGGTLFSTGLLTTTYVPPTTASLYWEILVVNGTAGVTSFTIYPNLYEIVAETSAPLLLGDLLVTNF